MFAKLFVAAIAASAVIAVPTPAVEVEKRITHTGQATYFETGLGACGRWNSDSDYIVALNSAQYEANNGANCGQHLVITNQETGITVDAYVADECPTCDYGSLDMSPALFGALSNNNFNEGVFPISWHFLKKQ